jgi:NAD(P)H-hydrate repair Nnr-like enzyme with NAD(P)H-hydrate dehydratase domain
VTTVIDPVTGSPRPRLWTAVDTAVTYRWPTAGDHKYSRGVLGLITGSPRFPGAGVLSTLGALGTGVGMVRHLGADAVQQRVLDRAPEVVTAPGRTDAYAIGSGTPELDPAAAADDELGSRMLEVLVGTAPVVVDAGALALLTPERLARPHRFILTPHAGEFARLATRLGIEVTVPDAHHGAPHHGAEETGAPEPADSAAASGRLGSQRADSVDEPDAAVQARGAAAAAMARATGCTVLLKGAITIVTDGSRSVIVTTGTPWHATAGTGDVLTGVIGAVLAGAAADGDPDLLAVAASGAWLHGRAGAVARGPFTIGQLAASLPEAVRGIAPHQDAPASLD